MEEGSESHLTAARYLKLLFLQVFLIVGLTTCMVNTGSDPAPLPTLIPEIENNTSESNGSATEPIITSGQRQASFEGISFEFESEFIGDLNNHALELPHITEANEILPERIEFTFSKPDNVPASKFYFFPVEQYSAISEEAKIQIASLTALLSEGPLQPNQSLPFLPLLHVEETFADEAVFVDFENGRGINYLVQIDEDQDPATADTIYHTFQGITQDHKYYVSLLVPVGEYTTSDTELSEGDISFVNDSDNNQTYFLSQKRLPSLLRMIHSLTVDPSGEFPNALPSSLATFSGVMVTYNPEYVKQVSFGRLPAIVTAPNGEKIFLADIPDLLRLEFEPTESSYEPSLLTIQPIRDQQSHFFASIPDWQRDQILAIEQNKAKTLAKQRAQQAGNFVRAVDFQNGFGQRFVTEPTDTGLEGSPLGFTYSFGGVTDDGRYLVLFEQSLSQMLSLDDADSLMKGEISSEILSTLSVLDQMIQSLAVRSDASETSSLPRNTADCINEAEFIEDLTIPDDSIIENGQTFRKTWRLRNSGTCTWMPGYMLIQAGGNPLKWQVDDFPAIVLPGEETIVSIDLISPNTPGKYHAWWQVTDAQGNPFGSFYSLLFEVPKPATDIPGFGTIEGRISYPAGGTPAVTVYFLRTDGSERYALETEEGWTRYVNHLPVGTYYVFAKVSGDDSDSGGGFTKAVTCNLNCDEHALEAVVINEGKATKGVDIVDWYAPAGTFPLP